MSMHKDLLTGVLIVVVILSSSSQNRIGLCARRALSLWGSTGVSGVDHIKSLVDSDGPENLVIHHATCFEN